MCTQAPPSQQVSSELLPKMSLAPPLVALTSLALSSCPTASDLQAGRDFSLDPSLDPGPYPDLGPALGPALGPDPDLWVSHLPGCLRPGHPDISCPHRRLARQVPHTSVQRATFFEPGDISQPVRLYTTKRAPA